MDSTVSCAVDNSGQCRIWCLRVKLGLCYRQHSIYDVCQQAWFAARLVRRSGSHRQHRPCISPAEHSHASSLKKRLHGRTLIWRLCMHWYVRTVGAKPIFTYYCRQAERKTCSPADSRNTSQTARQPLSARFTGKPYKGPCLCYEVKQSPQLSQLPGSELKSLLLTGYCPTFGLARHFSRCYTTSSCGRWLWYACYCCFWQPLHRTKPPHTLSCALHTSQLPVSDCC